MSAGSLVHSFCFADEPTESVYYLLQIWVKKWNPCTIFTYCSEIKFKQNFASKIWICAICLYFLYCKFKFLITFFLRGLKVQDNCVIFCFSNVLNTHFQYSVNKNSINQLFGPTVQNNRNNNNELSFMQNKKCILVYSEIPFCKNPYHIEPNQWTRFIDQLAGFSIIRVFTESCFQRDCNKVGFGLGKYVFGGQ